jgi:hypothetical protein
LADEVFGARVIASCSSVSATAAIDTGGPVARIGYVPEGRRSPILWDSIGHRPVAGEGSPLAGRGCFKEARAERDFDGDVEDKR